MRLRSYAAVVGVLLVGIGCGRDLSDTDRVHATIDGWNSAARSHDGQEYCALLTANSVEAIEGSNRDAMRNVASIFRVMNSISGQHRQPPKRDSAGKGTCPRAVSGYGEAVYKPDAVRIDGDQALVVGTLVLSGGRSYPGTKLLLRLEAGEWRVDLEASPKQPTTR